VSILALFAQQIVSLKFKHTAQTTLRFPPVRFRTPRLNFKRAVENFRTSAALENCFVCLRGQQVPGDHNQGVGKGRGDPLPLAKKPNPSLIYFCMNHQRFRPP